MNDGETSVFNQSLVEESVASIDCCKPVETVDEKLDRQSSAESGIQA